QDDDISPDWAAALAADEPVNTSSSCLDKQDNESVDTDSCNASMRNQVGLALASRGAWHRAIEQFTLAIEFDPRYAAAYCNRGYAYAVLKDYASAIRDFTRSIEFNSRCATAFNNRGLAYAVTGAYDDAIADCNAALRIDPKLALAY